MKLTKSKQAEIDKIDQWRDSNFRQLTTGSDIPIIFPGMPRKLFFLLSIHAMISEEYGEGEKVTFYVGDVFEDAPDIRHWNSQFIALLREWRLVPLDFVQRARKSWFSYQVVYVLSYNPQTHFFDANKVLKKKQFADYRQKRFF